MPPKIHKWTTQTPLIPVDNGYAQHCRVGSRDYILVETKIRFEMYVFIEEHNTFHKMPADFMLNLNTSKVRRRFSRKIKSKLSSHNGTMFLWRKLAQSNRYRLYCSDMNDTGWRVVGDEKFEGTMSVTAMCNSKLYVFDYLSNDIVLFELCPQTRLRNKIAVQRRQYGNSKEFYIQHNGQLAFVYREYQDGTVVTRKIFDQDCWTFEYLEHRGIYTIYEGTTPTNYRLEHGSVQPKDIIAMHVIDDKIYQFYHNDKGFGARVHYLKTNLVIRSMMAIRDQLVKEEDLDMGEKVKKMMTIPLRKVFASMVEWRIEEEKERRRIEAEKSKCQVVPTTKVASTKKKEGLCTIC